MPADTSHECFVQPASADAPVWRYMGIAGLALLLSRQALHFRRVELFDDWYEGRWPAVGAKKWRNRQREFGGDGGTDLVSDLERHTRACCFANCWCVQDHESAALWNAYGSDEAVAIRSTYGKLAQALPDKTLLGMVRYVDHDHVDVPIGNALMPVACKRREFAHEHEARAVLFWPEEVGFLSSNDLAHSPPKLPDVLWRSVDAAGLIEAVVTSPTAKPWFGEAVRAIVDRMMPGLTVRVSSMIPPR